MAGTRKLGSDRPKVPANGTACSTARLIVACTNSQRSRLARPIRSVSPPATPPRAARENRRIRRPATGIPSSRLSALRQAQLFQCRIAGPRSRALLAAHPHRQWQDPQTFHPGLAGQDTPSSHPRTAPTGPQVGVNSVTGPTESVRHLASLPATPQSAHAQSDSDVGSWAVRLRGRPRRAGRPGLPRSCPTGSLNITPGLSPALLRPQRIRRCRPSFCTLEQRRPSWLASSRAVT